MSFTRLETIEMLSSLLSDISEDIPRHNRTLKVLKSRTVTPLPMYQSPHHPQYFLFGFRFDINIDYSPKPKEAWLEYLHEAEPYEWLLEQGYDFEVIPSGGSIGGALKVRLNITEAVAFKLRWL